MRIEIAMECRARKRTRHRNLPVRFRRNRGDLPLQRILSRQTGRHRHDHREKPDASLHKGYFARAPVGQAILPAAGLSRPDPREVEYR